MPNSPQLSYVQTVLPRHYADQNALISAFKEQWSKQHFNLERLEQLHKAVQVQGRHLALPLNEYAPMEGFAARNNAWTQVAVELGEEAVSKAIEAAGLKATDVDHLFFTTVTGIATPSIDARLVNRLGLRTDVKRTPIFGLGCVAGVAGTSRASDVLRAFPDQVAVLLSVELCSLTLQREDLSIPNIIASGLFGDGAAALVLQGGGRKEARGPKVIATRSVFYPNTERIMGWDVVDTGFKVVLSAQVPSLVKANLRKDADAFLSEQGVKREEVKHWVAHTGGPKVLEAFEEALELPEGALERSWNSLREVGNLSSASVLFVLGDLLASDDASPGDYGMMIAMGPGFCSELVLLQW